jgi:hypothetical protein|tara:strand:- start:193 stop:444 length:252 start_codon:yes stop_codon:yes gene_type:complete
MSKTMYKHRNCIIEDTPSVMYPSMVTITKTPKVRSYFEERRYITLEKAHTAIETFESERLISSKEKYVKSQLQDVVVVGEDKV